MKNTNDLVLCFSVSPCSFYSGRGSIDWEGVQHKEGAIILCRREKALEMRQERACRKGGVGLWGGGGVGREVREKA